MLVAKYQRKLIQFLYHMINFSLPYYRANLSLGNVNSTKL